MNEPRTPDPIGDAIGEVVRLTDLDLRALAPYDQQLAETIAAINQAFTVLIAGKGIDPAEFECRRTPDGKAFIKRPRAAS